MPGLPQKMGAVLTQNSAGGFDIAELTHKNNAEPIPAQAAHISESAKKSRLLLISSYEVNELSTINNGRGESRPKKIKRTTNRKRTTVSDSITHNEKTYRIHNGKGKKKYGLYVEMLQQIIEQFEIGLTKWGRVFVLRFDLHCPFEAKDNKQITNFRKRLIQKLKRDYCFTQIGFCWAREYHGKGKGQHYHWALFLDGNLINHSSRINKIIKAVWHRPELDYHVPVIQRPFYFVNTEDIAQDAIYRVSYLAKTRGKGHRANQVKDYQCSRMKA